jgi:hypothetical protein
MATARKPFDWSDPKNLKERAWNSVKEFFGKEEEEHPLSPDTVAKESGSRGDLGATHADQNEADDSRDERIHRHTEQRALNEKPTIWPG